MYYCKRCDMYLDRLYASVMVEESYRLLLANKNDIQFEKISRQEKEDWVMHCHYCGNAVGAYNRDEALEHLIAIKMENKR